MPAARLVLRVVSHLVAHHCSLGQMQDPACIPDHGLLDMME